jgi:hypothetical protein
MHTITCEKCEKRYKVDPRLAGKTVKCKACGNAIAIPALETVDTGEMDLAPVAQPQAAARVSAPAPARPASRAKPAARPPALPANPCPQCGAPLAAEAKLCVECGYSLVTGKTLNTARDAAVPKVLRRGGSGTVLRVGNRLSASDQAVLPERCVKCNAEDGVQMTTKTYTYVPFWAILLTGYIIGYFLFRKSSTLTFGMCATHRRWRMIVSLVAVGGFIGAIGLIALGLNLNEAALQGVCLLMGLIGIFAAIAASILIPGIRAARIDAGGTAIYRGCGKAFLEGL